MKYENEVILVTVESMLLWNHIAETGDNKSDAIRSLTKAGMLAPPKGGYQHGCMLCESFLKIVSIGNNRDYYCRTCPWPGTGAGRCAMSSDSPFAAWVVADTISARKRVGKAVFALLSTMSLKGD